MTELEQLFWLDRGVSAASVIAILVWSAVLLELAPASQQAPADLRRGA